MANSVVGIKQRGPGEGDGSDDIEKVIADIEMDIDLTGGPKLSKRNGKGSV